MLRRGKSLLSVTAGEITLDVTAGGSRRVLRWCLVTIGVTARITAVESRRWNYGGCHGGGELRRVSRRGNYGGGSRRMWCPVTMVTMYGCCGGGITAGVSRRGVTAGCHGGGITAGVTAGAAPRFHCCQVCGRMAPLARGMPPSKAGVTAGANGGVPWLLPKQNHFIFFPWELHSDVVNKQGTISGSLPPTLNEGLPTRHLLSYS